MRPMEMLKSEQDTVNLSKLMMQSLDNASSLQREYVNQLSGSGGIVSIGGDRSSPSSSSLFNGLVNPSQLLSHNNMDASAMASLLEQMSAIQSQFNFQSQSLPNVLSNSPLSALTPNKEAYCDLCDKSFCNRYFLRIHRVKQHGMEDEGSPMKGMNDGESPIENGMTESGSNEHRSVIMERWNEDDKKMNIDGGMKKELIKDDIDDTNNTTQSMLDSLLIRSSSTTNCDECNMECPNIVSLIQHKATAHSNKGLTNESNTSPQSIHKCNECDLTFEDGTVLTQHSMIVHGQFGPLLGMLGGDAALPFLLHPQIHNPFSPLNTNSSPNTKASSAKRSYTSAGKNYCDVCNKEVCNKYFLRTHMLKMHGIVIDENKPVIANIDTRERERTGDLSFRCDMCSTVLKSRQQLREHKQSSHGVTYPVGTPSTLCTPSRPIKINSVTSPQSSQMMPPPPTPSSSSSSSLPIPSISSSIESFNIQSIPSTHNTPLPTSLSTSIESISSESPMPTVTNGSNRLNEVKEASVPQPIQSMAKCQHCIYTTRYPRNMEYHVERHERLNDMERGEGGVIEDRRDRISEDDDVMGMTTRVALQMATDNQVDRKCSRVECDKCTRVFSSPSFLQTHMKLFHSSNHNKTIKNTLAKKRNVLAKISAKRAKLQLKNAIKKSKMMPSIDKDTVETIGVERHSHTSGSTSPLRIPEGSSLCDSSSMYSLQSFTITHPLHNLPFPSQFTALLPVSSQLNRPISLTFTLTPHVSS